MSTPSGSLRAPTAPAMRGSSGTCRATADGLGVDVRVIGRVGGRVTTAVTASLVALLVISLELIHLLRLG